MGDRPRFRFRLPWLSAITAPRPGEPIRPSILKQTPTDQTTTTTIPINKPPFRPAGIAPSSQTQPPQNTKPRTPSSPPSEKRAVSVPPSQSRNAAQSEVGSQQTLRARVTDQARARGSGAQSQGPNTSQISITKTSSPSDARASSVPPSLSRGDAESKFNTKLTTSPPQTATKDPASSVSSAKAPASSTSSPSPSHITAKGPVSSIPSPERLTSPEKANKKVEPSHNASTTRTSTAFEPKQVTLKQISTRPSASHPGGEAPLRPSPSNKSTQAQIDEAVPQATSPPLQDTTNKASQLLPTTRQPNTSSRDQSMSQQ